MFIGRQRELQELEKLYASNGFQFVVVYGRHRVGKTALLNQFLQNKESAYVVGVESSAKQNLENLSKSLLEKGAAIGAIPSFASFQDALEFAFRMASDKRLILAIDEYPFMARSSASLASTLQSLIDKNKNVSKLMLILCGSSISYMEDHVLAYKAPLYGRRTAQIKLQPLSFEESRGFLRNFQGEDKALAYGVFGGTPQYLLQIDDRLSLEENVKNTFLNPFSFLFEEPDNLLRQELREPAVYASIVTAIAAGASRLSEIASKAGVPSDVCATYVKTLINLELVRKEHPYGETAARKSLYSISDNMFRFWYRFVMDNQSQIVRGAADSVYDYISPQFPNYMGSIFEAICQEYLWTLRLDDRTAVKFRSLGRWWGNDPAAKAQAEIDIMGEQDKDCALFAECKWTKEKVGSDILDLLVQRSHIFPYGNPWYYLFSRSGFTEMCQEQARKRKNVTLVSYEDILREYAHAAFP